MPDDSKKSLKRIVYYNPGEIIFKEGDIADCFYYIQSGKVTISKGSEAGEIITLNELNEGEIFGELGLLDKKENYRTACAKSKTKTTLLKAAKDNLLFLIKNNPTFAEKIILILVSRFDTSEKKMFNLLNHKNVEEKLYWYLINTILLIMTNSSDKILADVKIEVPYDKILKLINEGDQTLDTLIKVFEAYLTGKPKDLDLFFLKRALTKFDDDKFNHKFVINLT